MGREREKLAIILGEDKRRYDDALYACERYNGKPIPQSTIDQLVQETNDWLNANLPKFKEQHYSAFPICQDLFQQQQDRLNDENPAYKFYDAIEQLHRDHVIAPQGIHHPLPSSPRVPRKSPIAEDVKTLYQRHGEDLAQASLNILCFIWWNAVADKIVQDPRNLEQVKHFINSNYYLNHEDELAHDVSDEEKNTYTDPPYELEDKGLLL